MEEYTSQQKRKRQESENGSQLQNKKKRKEARMESGNWAEIERKSSISIVNGHLLTQHNVCGYVDFGRTFDDADFYQIGIRGRNVENKISKIVLRIQRPSATGTLFKSGKMSVMGARSVEMHRIASRRLARRVQRALSSPLPATDEDDDGDDGKHGPQQQSLANVWIQRYWLTNVCANYLPPLPGVRLDLQRMANEMENATFDPELTSQLIYRMKQPKATLNIYAKGKINIVGASSKTDLESAFGLIQPVLQRYPCADSIMPFSTAPPSSPAPSSAVISFSSLSSLASTPSLDYSRLPASLYSLPRPSTSFSPLKHVPVPPPAFAPRYLPASVPVPVPAPIYAPSFYLRSPAAPTQQSKLPSSAAASFLSSFSDLLLPNNNASTASSVPPLALPSSSSLSSCFNPPSSS